MSDNQETSVALGGCDEEGNRVLRMVSVLEPSSPSDKIQWVLDGEPLGSPMSPGELSVKVPGDGQVHLLELRVLSPSGVDGDRAEIKFPLCSSQVVGHIRSVDFAERQDDGSIPVRLISKVEPEGTEATVQWHVDGEPIEGPVSAGTLTTSISLAGGIHSFELKVIEPEGAKGDIEEVEVPGVQVNARIAVAEFSEGDEIPEPRMAVAMADGATADRVRAAQATRDRAALVGRNDDVAAEVSRHEADDPAALAQQKQDAAEPEPDILIAIDSATFQGKGTTAFLLADKVKLEVESSGRTGDAQWSLDGVNLGGPVNTPGAHVFSIPANGKTAAELKVRLLPSQHQPPQDPSSPQINVAKTIIDVPGTPRADQAISTDSGSFVNAQAVFVGGCIYSGEAIEHV